MLGSNGSTILEAFTPQLAAPEQPVVECRGHPGRVVIDRPNEHRCPGVQRGVALHRPPPAAGMGSAAVECRGLREQVQIEVSAGGVRDKMARSRPARDHADGFGRNPASRDRSRLRSGVIERPHAAMVRSS